MALCDDGAAAWLRLSSGFLALVAALLFAAMLSYMVVLGARPQSSHDPFMTELILVLAGALLLLAATGIGGTFAHHGGARWILLPYFLLHLLLFGFAVAAAVALGILHSAPRTNDYVAASCKAEPRPMWCGTAEEEEDLLETLADHWTFIMCVLKFVVVLSLVNLVAAFVTASQPPVERRTYLDLRVDSESNAATQPLLDEGPAAAPLFPGVQHPQYHAYPGMHAMPGMPAQATWQY